MATYSQQPPSLGTSESVDIHVLVQDHVTFGVNPERSQIFLKSSGIWHVDWYLLGGSGVLDDTQELGAFYMVTGGIQENKPR